MAIVAHDREQPRHEWTLRVFIAYGIGGLALLLWQTAARSGETAGIPFRLGHPWQVVLIFLAFSVAVSMLKFKLTDKIFVSFLLIGCMAMVPLLGGVVAAWIASGMAIAARLLAMAGIGLVKYEGAERRVEY